MQHLPFPLTAFVIANNIVLHCVAFWVMGCALFLDSREMRHLLFPLTAFVMASDSVLHFGVAFWIVRINPAGVRAVRATNWNRRDSSAS
jgi:hypothetical protein